MIQRFMALAPTRCPVRPVAGRAAPVAPVAALAALLALAIGLLAPGSATGGEADPAVTGPGLDMEKDLESLPTVRYQDIPLLPKLVPQKSEFYTINPAVKVYVPWYIYRIETNHGPYTVISTSKLMKVMHEIYWIENFRQDPAGKEVLDGALQPFKDTGKGAKQVVLHPGQSAVAIGSGVAKSVRSVGRIFAKPFRRRGPSSTGEARDAGTGFLVSAQGREFAYAQGLDVYTDNPYVQAVIKRISAQRLSGRLVSKIAIKLWNPIPYLTTVTGGALTGRSKLPHVEKAIGENDPAELRRILKIQYMRTFNVKKEQMLVDFTAFLNNPNFSPREQAYITEWVCQMASYRGQPELAAFLSAVDEVEEARVVTQQIELYNALFEAGGKQGLWVATDDYLATASPAGLYRIILPYDYLDHGEGAREVLAAIAEAAARSKARSRELWLTGGADKAFRDAAAQAGLRVRNYILADPVFQGDTTETPTP